MRRAMTSYQIEDGLDQFLSIAMVALSLRQSPAHVRFNDPSAGITPVPSTAPATDWMNTPSTKKTSSTWPEDYLSLARILAHHSSSEKWQLLYRLLWRTKFERSDLMQLVDLPNVKDADVQAAQKMRLDVMLAVAQLEASTRFTPVESEDAFHSQRKFAWVDEAHPVLSLAAPFFVRARSHETWSLFSKNASIHWDGHTLSQGAPPSRAPMAKEDLSNYWQEQEATVLNPLSTKLLAMSGANANEFWAVPSEADFAHEERATSTREKVERPVESSTGT